MLKLCKVNININFNDKICLRRFLAPLPSLDQTQLDGAPSKKANNKNAEDLAEDLSGSERQDKNADKQTEAKVEENGH